MVLGLKKKKLPKQLHVVEPLPSIEKSEEEEEEAEEEPEEEEEEAEEEEETEEQEEPEQESKLPTVRDVLVNHEQRISNIEAAMFRMKTSI